MSKNLVVKAELLLFTLTGIFTVWTQWLAIDAMSCCASKIGTLTRAILSTQFLVGYPILLGVTCLAVRQACSLLGVWPYKIWTSEWLMLGLSPKKNMWWIIHLIGFFGGLVCMYGVNNAVWLGDVHRKPGAAFIMFLCMPILFGAVWTITHFAKIITRR